MFLLFIYNCKWAKYFWQDLSNNFQRGPPSPGLLDTTFTIQLVLWEISTGFCWSVSQMTPNYPYNVRKHRKPHDSTCTGHCTMGKMRGQTFEHSSNYFTIWRNTKMLISQSNLNGFQFCKKTPVCLSFASLIKHSPHF